MWVCSVCKFFLHDETTKLKSENRFHHKQNSVSFKSPIDCSIFFLFCLQILLSVLWSFINLLVYKSSCHLFQSSSSGRDFFHCMQRKNFLPLEEVYRPTGQTYKFRCSVALLHEVSSALVCTLFYSGFLPNGIRYMPLGRNRAISSKWNTSLMAYLVQLFIFNCIY